MDLGGVGGILLNQINDPSSSLYHLHQRFQPEDSRSDSGVSSLRSGSGDERSGSRSSALSCPDDGPSLPPQVVATPPHSSSSSSSSSNCSTSSLSAQSHNRSPLFIPASPSALSSRHHLQHEQQGGASSGSEPVRVWRDPNLLLEEPHVRHVHSVQHQASLFQTLLMSHSSSPSSGGASSGGGAGGPPPTSSSAASMGVYPVAPPPPPSLIGPPHVPHHPHLGHAPLYHPAQFSADMLWKATNRASPYGVPAHLLNATAASVGQQQQQQGQGHAGAEEMMAERERAAMAMQDRDRQERMFRERQNQEMAEKQQKEKERMEREKQEHKEKIERERQEKELELALHNHFEKSLRAVHQKREQWNPTTNRPPQSRTSSLSEDDRKRVEEIHHREQQRHMTVRDSKDHRGYYGAVQRPASVPGKTEYPPPPAHSRVGGPACKPAPDKMASHGVPQQQQAGQPSKNEMQHVYGYASVQQQQQNAYFEPKMKTEMHKSGQQQQQQGGGGLVVTKSMDRGDGGAMVGEMKNSVIVKHDTKNPHHLDQPRVSMAHSPSPKLRNEMMGHYQSQTGQNKGMYEYRSPTQSPHHLAHVAPTSHHQHQVEAQNMAKVQLQQQQQQQHRPQPQTSSPHQLQQRHSPHQHPQQQHLQQQQQHLQQQQQHHANEMRYRSGAEAQAMVYHAAKTNYPYTTSTYTMSTMSTMSATPTAPPNAKSKVSSPAPHQIFGKPPLGGVSVVPVTRPLVHHDLSGATGATPVQLTANKPVPSISSSPYQQVSQYHLPHNAAPSQLTCPPPPAHSSRASTTSGLLMDRYAPPAGLSVKLVGVGVAGTSPPTATSAPLAGVGVGGGGGGRGHGGFAQSLVAGQQVQTQPLDLGVSSAKFENHPSSPKRKSSTPISQLGVGANPGSPVCLEVKKRRIDTPPATTQFVSVSAHSASVSAHNPPQLARVSEPSPLIASAATTITTVVNAAVAFRTTPPTALISRQTPPPEVGGVVELVGGRPESTSPKPATPTATAPLGGSPAPLSAATTPTMSVTPQPAEESPGTPAKVNPSVLDSEKSNSPGPQKNPSSASYPVRHLKKAWLQRHTGEDVEDTTGVVGSGSCLTLPLNIKADLGATGAAGATGATPTAAAATNANAATVTKENPVNSIHSIGSMAVNSINKTKHFSSKATNRKAAKEATVNGDAKNDDSSSSDQERGRKSPPKRKPPKVKRKKGGTSAKKAVEEKKRKSGPQSVAVASESGSDSDKESGSEKDSDSGASASAPTKKSAGTGKEQRKRGRKPKGGSKNDKGEEPRPKKSKDDAPPPPRDPSRKPPVGQLKKTGESFLQYGTCFEVAPKLAKCRECRWTVNQRSKNVPNIFCRFYAFRRLRYTKNGQLAIAGFSDPHKDALEEDLKLWLPNADHPPADLDLETSRFLLKQVADHFCDLFLQEKEANTEHMSEDKTVAWKRVVQGVREMCDVCETTLFNCHWACGKCGFVVCIDCYKSRKKGAMKMWGEPGKDRDEFSWLLCTNRQAHEQEKLMLTQIIAGDSLNKLGRMVHETRELWNIEQFCGCPMIKEFTQKTNNLHAKEIVRSILGDKVNGVKKEIKDEDDTRSQDGEEKKKPPMGSSSEEDEDEGEGGNFSTLRELLIRPSHKPNGSSSSRAGSPVVAAASASSKGTETRKKLPAPTKPADLDDVISSVIEDSVPQKVEAPSEPKHELKHFIRRYNWAGKGRVQLPIRIMTLTESKMLYPDTPHSWLCDGKLLRLSDPLCKANYKIFQDQWKRGQPVIVSDVTRNADPDLWHPEAFARDFGDEKNDLVNCMTGNLVPNQPMRKFWEGFDHFSKRLKDDRGQSMLLKLKDWPPGEDFAEIMPSRYADLMKVLPLAEYTHRTGRLNLASRLPECFVRPDLGPKMYNAYGSALHPNKGTTNLHLDISDAVNVMVYVGIPKDGDTDEHIKEAFRAIDEAGCDILTRRRVRDKGELPGALWHIYNARDADKIRDLLNKVVVEKGGRLEPHHDPIHDQSCYLDGPLRERLYKEYGVEGYAIVQCKGDAVFIPAGAPHQVRNLHNCIKVAEDFVSPENVSHCFHLTQEFRDLTDTHSNHEDKLQIKNIIYHAVKDALSALEAVIERHDAENAAAKSSDDGSATTTSNDGDNSGKSDSNEGV